MEAVMKLDHAIREAKAGHLVFPVLPGDSKKPPKDFHFKTEATSNIEKITHWWTNGYSKHNIGIYAGGYKECEALIVIDVDCKKGKMGEDTIQRFKQYEGLDFPVTKTVRTPSGGYHLYYKTSKAVKQGTDVLGDGVDIRSRDRK